MITCIGLLSPKLDLWFKLGSSTPAATSSSRLGGPRRCASYTRVSNDSVYECDSTLGVAVRDSAESSVGTGLRVAARRTAAPPDDEVRFIAMRSARERFWRYMTSCCEKVRYH